MKPLEEASSAMIGFFEHQFIAAWTTVKAA